MDVTRIKPYFGKIVYPVLPDLPPHLLTGLAVLFGAASLLLLIHGRNIMAAIAYLLAAFLHLLDGAVASKYGRASIKSAVLDRIADRAVDAFGIIGLSLVSSKVLGLFTLAVILIASYISSVYEGFRRTKEGEKLSKRPFKSIIIILGMAFKLYMPALIALFVVGLYAIASRLVVVVRNL